jgi:DNA-binding transcriptional regulator YbjK
MRRKPNAEERRRDLCDAAIELLAEDGARGLTHLRVDRRAGVADGTTSFYYQTRSALLRGATDRVVQLDVADFTAAMNEAKATRATKPNRCCRNWLSRSCVPPWSRSARVRAPGSSC